MIAPLPFVDCFKCMACKDSRYQVPPMLMAGISQNSATKILIVAQNPGEIQADRDPARMLAVEALNVIPQTDDGLLTWYTLDFMTSRAYVRMQQIFGKDFMTSGKYLYTNAVRCRTKGNATPSDEMVRTCGVWTRAIITAIRPSGIIIMGNVARTQLLLDAASKLEHFKPKRHAHLGPLLFIPHFAAIRDDTTLKQCQSAVASFEESVTSEGVDE